MIKTYKVQLLLNKEQESKLFQFAGSTRFAYNWALEREQENHKNGGKFLSDSDLRKEFTLLKKEPEKQWLNQISNNVTKQVIKKCGNKMDRDYQASVNLEQYGENVYKKICKTTL